MKSFNWDDHPVVQNAPSSPREPSAKFNWDDHPVVESATQDNEGFDWSSPVSSGLKLAAKKGAENLKAAGEFIDSYTGAPSRAFLDSAIDGKNPLDAFANQFGADPSKAPDGYDIAAKVGVPENIPSSYGPNIPDTEGAFERPYEIPARSLVGTAVNVGADWTNALPAIGLAGKAIGKTETGAKALAAAGEGLSKVSNGAKGIAKEAGKRAVSVFFGPDISSINRYLERASEVRSAKSVEEIKNSIDETMSHLFDGVEQAKLSKDEAKEALKIVEGKIRDTVRDANFQFRVDQADLKQSFNEARSKLDRAYEGEKAKLASVKSPIQLKDDVATAIQDLKERVRNGSAESYDILDQDTRGYGVRNAGKVLRQMADEMNIKAFEPKGENALVASKQSGTPISASRPVTSQSIGVQNELRKFAALLEQTPEAVPASELKKILQQIDASEMAAYGQPGFDSRVSQAYKMIRNTIDQAIKAKNPAYAAKMEQVAADMGLMQKAINRFGDERSTLSRLNSIGSRTSDPDRQLLKQLGEATGRDFEGPIYNFQVNQAALKDPAAMESLKKSLPEYGAASAAETKAAELSRPEAQKQFVQNALEGEGLPRAQVKAKQGVFEADQRLNQANEKLSPFKRLTPETTQAKVKALVKAPGKENIEIRRTIEELSKASEKDFVNWIADRRAADQFSGEFRIGSRNVGLWTLIGSAGGLPGASVGAVVGAVVDRFGPKMAQKILDGALAIKGNPSKSKIVSLKLEPKVEHFLLRELTKAQALESDALRVSGPDNQPKRGRDKWANDGFEKLIEHSPDSALQENREKLLSDPGTKDLLIRASDLKPGTKAMDDMMIKIKNRVGQN